MDEVPARLQLFHKTRHERAEYILAFSRSQGRTTPDKYVEGTVPIMDFFSTVYKHDALAHAEEALKEFLGEKEK